MERPVDEVFFYYGHHFIVVQDLQDEGGCNRCAVAELCQYGESDKSVLGKCQGAFRSDGKEVHFESFGVDF